MNKKCVSGYIDLDYAKHGHERPLSDMVSKADILDLVIC